LSEDKKTKFVPKDLAVGFAEEVKALRYFEITTKDDAKEVFNEVARVVARDRWFEITKMPEALVKLQKEKKSTALDVRKKQLKCLPNLFLLHSHNLQKLRLDGNQIKFFPMEVFACTQLRELTLNNNAIEVLPPTISKLNLLTRLEIENNQLATLPIRELQQMENLQDFRAAGNHFGSLPAALKGKGNLLTVIRQFKCEELPKAEPESKEKEREPFKVFGVDLQELMVNEYQLFPGNPIPRIFRYSVNFILTKGIAQEGIFRLAGQKTRCEQIRDEFDTGLTNDFSPNEAPNEVANVLKQWLRGLPQPILLLENYEKIQKMAG